MLSLHPEQAGWVLQQGVFSWAKRSPPGTAPALEKGFWVGCTPWLSPASATGDVPSRVSPPTCPPHLEALLGVTTRQDVLIFPKLFGFFFL